MANSEACLSFVLLLAFLLSSHVLAHHELHETAPIVDNQHSYNDEGNVFKHPNPTSLQVLDVDWRKRPGQPSFRHHLGPGYKTLRLEDVEKSTRTDNAQVDDLKESKSDWTFPQVSHKTKIGIGRGYYTHSTGYNPSNLEAVSEPPPIDSHKTLIGAGSHQYNHLASYNPSNLEVVSEPPLIDPRETMIGIGSGQYTHSTSYNPSNLEVSSEPPPAALDETMIETGSGHHTYSAGYNPSNLKVIEPKKYEDASVTRHRNMVRPSEIDWRTFRAFPAKTYGMRDGGKTGYGVPRMEDVGRGTMN